MLVKALGTFLFLWLLALSSGCGGDEAPPRPVQAVTSITVLADMVAAVGGERVDVASLLPPGADPHTYEPRPSDVRAISEADVAFLNGLGLEPASLRVVESSLPASATLLRIAEEAADQGYPLIGENAGGANPHLWLSVDAARLYVQVIRDALLQTDPEGESTYRQNYDAYLEELSRVEAYLEQKERSVPPSNRKIVSTHDAFPYLARDIGFEVAAVVATSPGQDPSAADIAELTDLIQSTGVPAVFREPQLGSEASILEAAADVTGAEVCVLYSGALDDDVRSYLELMRYNADELARCLGGN